MKLSRVEALEEIKDQVARIAEATEYRNLAVLRARQNGATWKDIGEALGISESGAWQQYSKLGTTHCDRHPNGTDLACKMCRRVSAERNAQAIGAHIGGGR